MTRDVSKDAAAAPTRPPMNDADEFLYGIIGMLLLPLVWLGLSALTAAPAIAIYYLLAAVLR